MILDFDINKFLKRMLPIHKRQTNRLKFFWWPLKNIQSLWNEFKEYRKDVFFKANMTGSTISLEAYLNKYVDGANGSISIIESNDYGTWVGFESEASDVIEAGLEDIEPDDYVEIAIDGEPGLQLPVKFRVIAPETANVEQINKYVNLFKLAGKSFDVTS